MSPPRLHDEIRETLAESRLDGAERADLARDALALTDRLPPLRRRLPLVPVVVAGLALAGLAGLLLRPGPPAPAAPGDPDRERETNLAVLATDEVREALEACGEGYAVISGGRLVGTGPDLLSLLEEVREETAAAEHRFVFPVGEEGDVSYQVNFHHVPGVGTKVLSHELVDLFGRKEDRVWPIRYDGSLLRMKVDWGPPGTPELRTTDFVVNTGFTGPFLLEDGQLFPRFEIPGQAVIGGVPGSDAVYRRHLIALPYGALEGEPATALFEALGRAAPAAEEPPEPVPAIPPFTWLRVPSGPFHAGESGAAETRSLGAFEILKYEVTRGQWYHYRREHPAGGAPPERPSAEEWTLPVVGITYAEAGEFCARWLSRQPGCEGARLPTDAEWEKAARGSDDDRPYPWGREFFRIDERTQARIPLAHVLESGMGAPSPVRLYEKTDRSPYGVIGMAGNVSEFVSTRAGPAFRGGCYLTDARGARIRELTRFEYGGGFRWRFVGFRAARSVPRPR